MTQHTTVGAGSDGASGAASGAGSGGASGAASGGVSGETFGGVSEVASEVAGAEDRPDLAGPSPSRVFGQLFDRHARSLHRYLARRVGDLADDLVGETFLVAYQTRTGYDPQRGTARSWLYGIATNLLRRHVRQEVRGLAAAARAAGSTAGGEDHGGRVADQVDAAARTRLLAGALAELDAGDRDVLLLTSWAGLDSNEVAEALGIPVGTVRSRLHRVRRRLRAHASETDARTGDE